MLEQNISTDHNTHETMNLKCSSQLAMEHCLVKLITNLCESTTIKSFCSSSYHKMEYLENVQHMHASRLLKFAH